MESSESKEGSDVIYEAYRIATAAREQKLHSVIHALQNKVKSLEAASSDSKKSQIITALQSYINERELIIDVLKVELTKASGSTREDVESLVVRKTIGGPARLRPKQREELALDIVALEQKLHQAARALDVVERDLNAAKGRYEAECSKSARLAQSLVQAQTEAEALRARLDKARQAKEEDGRKDSAAVAALQAQLASLSSLEGQASELGLRYRSAVQALGSLQEQVGQAKAGRAQAEAQASKAQQEAEDCRLKMQEALAEAQAARAAQAAAEEAAHVVQVRLDQATAAMGMASDRMDRASSKKQSRTGKAGT